MKSLELVIRGTTWAGETEISESIRAMAHVIDGVPDVDNSICKVYRESIGKEAVE